MVHREMLKAERVFKYFVVVYISAIRRHAGLNKTDDIKISVEQFLKMLLEKFPVKCRLDSGERKNFTSNLLV